jgi:hypothetical protein
MEPVITVSFVCFVILSWILGATALLHLLFKE